MEEQTIEPWQEALQKFLNTFPEGPLGTETLDLHHVLGRTLATQVPARIDTPPFSQALMEGFLVHVQDTAPASAQSSVSLKISGKIEPGRSEVPRFQNGECLEVMTGSLSDPPKGETFAVASFRDVRREGDHIRIQRPFQPFENIEMRGKETRRGDTLLAKGVRLHPEEIGLLAGQGILQAEVARRPVVAIFSSGNEVLSPPEPLSPGSVWDANSYSLSAFSEKCGGHPRLFGIMRDDPVSFQEALRKALTECDMAVISGGTAAGGGNFIADLVQAAGAPGIIINGVPMRSGKPLIMGVVGKKPIVCVAGYPPEALRGFNLFGRPTIARLLGIPG
jgi:putative molybdopterin biosynthesis protein